MAQNIIGAVICAAAGVLVAYLNYALSKGILKTHPEKFALATVARQVVQVGYLIAVYFIGAKLSENPAFMLVGAVVGMTVPMLFFTKKLLNFNEALGSQSKKGKEDENG